MISFFECIDLLIALSKVQTMAKSANSKVIFVPMHLQGEVAGQSAKDFSASIVTNEAGSDIGGSSIGRAGLLGAISDN